MLVRRKSNYRWPVVGAVATVLVASALALTSVAAERSGEGAGGAKAEVAIGKPAPAFTLQDQAGKTVSLSDYSGKIVVLEWFNNSCPYVQKHYKTGHMNTLAKTYEGKGVVWLAINSTKDRTVDDNKSIADQWGINRPILSDARGATGHAYHARTTPHMFIVDKDGKLAYMGAIDSVASDDSEDIAKATNYVAAALDEMLAGKPVSKPETKPYGCSVKYAK
jgi:peroxiredoxin